MTSYALIYAFIVASATYAYVETAMRRFEARQIPRERETKPVAEIPKTAGTTHLDTP